MPAITPVLIGLIGTLLATGRPHLAAKLYYTPSTLHPLTARRCPPGRQCGADHPVPRRKFAAVDRASVLQIVGASDATRSRSGAVPGLTVGDGRSCGLKCQIGSPRNAIRQP